MFQLKPLSKDAIPSALAKAERYRLLNEPHEAESICHDVLSTEPHNQAALVTLILAITDQFTDEGGHVARAQQLLPRLQQEYDRLYYGGIICERRARTLLTDGGSHAGALARDWFVEALRLFDQAIAVHPAGNEDAVLRWNACVRSVERLPARDVDTDVPVILSE
jgi:hypothetical protein